MFGFKHRTQTKTPVSLQKHFNTWTNPTILSPAPWATPRGHSNPKCVATPQLTARRQNYEIYANLRGKTRPVAYLGDFSRQPSFIPQTLVNCIFPKWLRLVAWDLEWSFTRDKQLVFTATDSCAHGSSFQETAVGGDRQPTEVTDKAAFTWFLLMTLCRWAWLLWWRHRLFINNC